MDVDEFVDISIFQPKSLEKFVMEGKIFYNFRIVRFILDK